MTSGFKRTDFWRSYIRILQSIFQQRLESLLWISKPGTFHCISGFWKRYIPSLIELSYSWNRLNQLLRECCCFYYHSNSTCNATCYSKSNCGIVASLLTPWRFCFQRFRSIDLRFKPFYSDIFFSLFSHLISFCSWRTNQGDDTEAM